jgi:hypothetical protein
MSKNIIFVLIYHRRKLLDLTHVFSRTSYLYLATSLPVYNEQFWFKRKCPDVFTEDDPFESGLGHRPS